jgi:hypothetical protein
MKTKFKKMIMETVKQMGFNESRQKVAGDTVIGLLEQESVAVKRLSRSLLRRGVSGSMRALERFFLDSYVSNSALGETVLTMLGLSGKKITLLIDRTNWDFGTKHINILVIAFVYQGFSIPIYIDTFTKKGNSHTQERKKALIKIIDLVGVQNIESILGDREFIGSDWFNFLEKHKIPFVIRIRNNMFITLENGYKINANLFMAHVKYGEQQTVHATISGVCVQVCATRSKTGALVIVAASLNIQECVLTKYRIRWLIELFFKSIKSKGFNLEETHMTDPDKINTLMALISIASMITVKAGCFKNLWAPIPVKKTLNRKLFSLFSYGLDFIRNTIFFEHSNNPPRWFHGTLELFQQSCLDFIFGNQNVGY